MYYLKIKIFKLKGGGGFKPHQDHLAFTKFIKNEIFNIMVPIDDMRISNGCLYISKTPFKKRQYLTIKETH
ncbi:phytanoyl-CoA dioxygenase family protein [Xenorhabdus thailandensis]|uniref:phytanoyl-CoA dioxygenase family protein n=1 Tax=Xenorhabdus thailandensis TaxID=3136255 RepID=UPI003BF4E8FB